MKEKVRNILDKGNNNQIHSNHAKIKNAIVSFIENGVVDFDGKTIVVVGAVPADDKRYSVEETQLYWDQANKNNFVDFVVIDL